MNKIDRPSTREPGSKLSAELPPARGIHSATHGGQKGAERQNNGASKAKLFGLGEVPWGFGGF